MPFKQCTPSETEVITSVSQSNFRRSISIFKFPRPRGRDLPSSSGAGHSVNFRCVDSAQGTDKTRPTGGLLSVKRQVEHQYSSNKKGERPHLRDGLGFALATATSPPQ